MISSMMNDPNAKHDGKLRGMGLRSYWGMSNSSKSCNNVATYRDNEVIYAVGSKLVIFDYVELKSRIIPLHYFDISSINLFILSPDKRYLSVSFKSHVSSPGYSDRKMQAISIDLEGQTGIPRKPQLIEYIVEPSIEVEEPHFCAMAYSHCSSYWALCSNAPEVGMFVVDRFSGNILHRVATNNVVMQISFNPIDKNRLCVSGKFNLFQFWRVTDKMMHNIPVSCLLKGNQTYSCHLWVPGADNKIVAGTQSGCLLFVSGGEIVSSKKTHPFGAPERAGRVDCGIVDLLIRNDVIVCISALNVVSLFELRKGPVNAAGNLDIDFSFVKLARFRFPIANITGLQWVTTSTTSNYEVIVSTMNSLMTIDLKAGDYKMAAVETQPSGSGSSVTGHNTARLANAAGKGVAITAGGAQTGRNSGVTTSNAERIEWLDIKPDKCVLSFHSGNVHSLSVGCRNSSFVTASDDESIRVWDFSKPNNPCVLVDSFSDRKNVVPNSICMHPMGNTVAFGCEDDVREFYITDSKFEMVRKLPTKVPFTGPGDVPLVNTVPVSLVRYSHGGHLLAAVTGRMAQLFHMYTLEFSSNEPAGLPSRCMAITDHKANINDLIFSSDDSQIFTCSADGSVYSWMTFRSERTGEFVEKGVPALKLAVSWSNLSSPFHIVASYASDYIRQNTSVGRKLYMSQATGLNRGDKDRRRTGMNRMASNSGNVAFGVGAAGGQTSNLGGATASPLMRAASEMSLTINPDNNAEDAGTKSGAKRYFLCVWKDKLSPNPEVIYVECPVTAVAFGRLDGHWSDRKDALVMGLLDGRIIICFTPVPYKVVNLNTIYSTNPNFTVTTPMSTGLGGGTTMLSRTQSGAAGFSKFPGFFAEGEEEFGGGGDTSNSRTTGFGANKSAGNLLSMTPTNNPPSNSAPITLLSPMPVTARTASNTPGAVVSTGLPQTGAGIASTEVNLLDLNHCIKMQLHAAEVAEVTVSSSGFWIFTTGFDNCVFMIATSNRAKEFSDVPESHAFENTLLITEKSHFQYLKGRMEEVDSAIEETRRDCDRSIHKITEQKNALVAELEVKMKREVQKRDDIILRGREDQARQVKKLNDEMTTMQKKLSEDIVELEYAYEKKLSQEALYLEKMRQAFDEVVVHSRLDMMEAQRQVALYDANLAEQRKHIVAEADKQKQLVLAYVDYVKNRYTEVIESLETGQEDERIRLKGDVQDSKSAVDDMRKQTKEEIVVLNRSIKELEKNVRSTEEEGYKLRSDLEWAQTRNHSLETALVQATSEVKRYQDAAEKWEFRVGEYQEQIKDLEK
jgi:WD40 repeat protein